MRTTVEYKQYLYNLFVETAQADDPLVAQINKHWKDGKLAHGQYIYPFLQIHVYFKTQGIVFDKQPLNEKGWANMRGFALHTVASVMRRHHISFDEAMSWKYLDDRWESCVDSDLDPSWKYLILSFTKSELVGE